MPANAFRKIARAVVTCGLVTVACNGSKSSSNTGSDGSGGGPGGVAQTGGATGGVTGTGGVFGTGGVTGTGGRTGTGGVTGSGGVTGTVTGTGGTGTVTGTGTGTGGRSGTGGAGTGGSTGADGGVGTCKRGIAANTAPGAAFFPAVTWWYNWAISGSGAKTGIGFVPMIWGSGSVNSAIPSGSKYLLTFNEPNFKAQSNLTAAAAASYWPTIQTKAAGIPIVGPGMNFCGPADQCNGTDPYQYLTDFFAACTSCEVDYVAVHWYNCDLPSLKDYLEPGGSLAGFEQFGKPIWLTELSCDTSASAAQQEAYMRAAIPYLEGSAKVFRYSWFSADPIPNAKLINSDGSPTALGQVYIGLPQNCQL
jgi:hypothetical protein